MVVIYSDLTIGSSRPQLNTQREGMSYSPSNMRKSSRSDSRTIQPAFFSGLLLSAFFLLLSLTSNGYGLEVNITRDIGESSILHAGRPIMIKRNQDTDALLEFDFARTSRPCPPFCAQPMKIASVETIGEACSYGGFLACRWSRRMENRWMNDLAAFFSSQGLYFHSQLWLNSHYFHQRSMEDRDGYLQRHHKTLL